MLPRCRGRSPQVACASGWTLDSGRWQDARNRKCCLVTFESASLLDPAQSVGRVQAHGTRAARQWGIAAIPPLRVRSARGLVPVGATAQALLHEVDHAPRLPCRAGDHFDVTVEVEQDESPTLPRWRRAFLESLEAAVKTRGFFFRAPSPLCEWLARQTLSRELGELRAG